MQLENRYSPSWAKGMTADLLSAGYVWEHMLNQNLFNSDGFRPHDYRAIPAVQCLAHSKYSTNVIKIHLFTYVANIYWASNMCHTLF